MSTSPYQSFEEPGAAPSTHVDSNEVAELRKLVAMQAEQQKVMQAEIAALRSQQQQATQPQRSTSPRSPQLAQHSPPPAYAPTYPARYAPSVPAPPTHQTVQMTNTVNAPLCQVPHCRNIATQRCGYRVCCDTCNMQICVQHSGWASTGSGYARSRVPACPQHQSNCVIS